MSVKPQIQNQQYLLKLLEQQKKLINKIKDKDLKEKITSKNSECMQLVRPQKIVELANVHSILARVIGKSKSKESSSSKSSSSSQSPTCSSSTKSTTTTTTSSSSPSSKSVSRVKLVRKPSSFKYRVKWKDGRVSQVTASQFVKNYKLNYHFIIFARQVDYMDFFNSFMVDELKKYCQSIGTSQSK